MAPAAPALLKRKLAKIQNMRTDTPAMLEALDALSTFYSPTENNLEARRNLRGDLESRGLMLVDKFIGEFEPIQSRIDLVSKNVKEVHDICDMLTEKLNTSASKTNEFAKQAKTLANKRAQFVERANVMDDFLKRFKLSENQLNALSGGPQDQDGGAMFFSALEDVQRIRDECQDLISSQFQSTGLELFDAMASFQEQAYEQLYGWVRAQCIGLDAEFPDADEALQKGIKTLAQAPAYYEHARDCIVETRSTSMATRFAFALTHGGPHGNPRPIEMHAHDPLRYVGDMLAWIHKSMAVEKSLVFRLFAPGEDAEIKAANVETLNSIFKGVVPPLVGRVEQVLHSFPPLVLAFKICNLLEFYVGTFKLLLDTPTGLVVDTIQGLQKEASGTFFSIVQSHCDKLLASPPAYPRDLSVALEVNELIRRLGEILVVHNEAMASGDASGIGSTQDREERFAPILDAFIDPLLAMCRQSASGLDRSDAAVYIVNNMVAIQSSLTRYDFTVSWVQRLTTEIGDWVDVLVKEQSDNILRHSAMAEKIECIERADPSTPLVSQPGMDIESLRSALDSFYKSLFSLVMPEFDRLTSPRLRASARNATAQTIANSYEAFYNAVMDKERSGIDEASLKGILLHNPQQVRQLVDA